MLSAADFPDIFPWMAERLPRHQRGSGTEPPTTSSIARWEDDGGRTLNRASASRPPTAGHEAPSDPVPWFVPFVAAPALAVATMAILSTPRTGPLR